MSALTDVIQHPQEKADELERLRKAVDEISGLITQFKHARNTTGSIDAIAKIVVWNVEHEERIAKEKREDAQKAQ